MDDLCPRLVARLLEGVHRLNTFRGGEGPLTTEFSSFQDPLFDAYFDAALSIGFPITDDINGEQQEGFGRLQVTVKNGRRCSAATAYLRPALDRGQLTVKTHALTHYGVSYRIHPANTAVDPSRGLPRDVIVS
jgi:choline dehydrogenase-like flavoprotein